MLSRVLRGRSRLKKVRLPLESRGDEGGEAVEGREKLGDRAGNLNGS